MRALVTGAAGFIGRHLTEALIADGATVVGVDNMSGGGEFVHDYLGFVEADLLNPEVRDAATRGIDVVFHQAAIPSVMMSISNPLTTHENGSHLTALLLESARKNGVKRFIQASTCAVYGDMGASREDEGLDIKSPYAAEKAAAESMAAAYSDCYEMDTCSLRYFNVYGPRQNPVYAGVITRLCESVSQGKKFTIFGDGKSVRDYIHVSDIVRANLLAASSKSRIAGRGFNVGTGVGTSVLELIRTFEDVSGRKIEYEHGEKRHEILESRAVTSLARSLLGFSAEVPLKDGLTRILS